MDWINVHTHRVGVGINIVNAFPGKGCPLEDGAVRYSLGIHPAGIDGFWRKRLEEIEEAARAGRIIAIGEAGLDRNAACPLQCQEELFRLQAGIASRYTLPLIIHMVRTVPELIGICKSFPALPGLVIHGFNNRRELLHDLLGHGFYISVGRQVLNERSNVFHLLPEIPYGRLFMETDDSDCSIEEIYRAVALRRGISVEELQRFVRRNFEKVFLK